MFCQMMLNGGIYAHRRLLRRATVAQFMAPDAAAIGRADAGMDEPTDGEFVGRALFFARELRAYRLHGNIDVDRSGEGLFVALLTNRVNPTRANEKIRAGSPGGARCDDGSAGTGDNR